ncbi:MAG: hypothetical protein ABI553_10835 [Chloroflexota bacterium]
MSTNPLPGLRRAALAGAIVGLLAISASPAAADTVPSADKSYSQNGSTAEITVGGCIDNGDDTLTCSDEHLAVFAGKMTDGSTVTHPNQICVEIFSVTQSALSGEWLGDPTFERGCRTDLPTTAIRFDSKLAWATLAPTTLTVEQLVCDKVECIPGASRVVGVSGAWTQDGPLETMKYRTSFSDGTCRWSEAFKGAGRNATFVGELDGRAIGEDSHPHLDSGKYTFRSRCDEV